MIRGAALVFTSGKAVRRITESGNMMHETVKAYKQVSGASIRTEVLGVMIGSMVGALKRGMGPFWCAKENGTMGTHRREASASAGWCCCKGLFEKLGMKFSNTT
mmetsp:Transcript_6554/g.10256  ORF Transcript_6554/g.10256 Transcript_6554/m.10256 type:complete len:104 (+) Transcript_6554:688-999(+)